VSKLADQSRAGEVSTVSCEVRPARLARNN